MVFGAENSGAVVDVADDAVSEVEGGGTSVAGSATAEVVGGTVSVGGGEVFGSAGVSPETGVVERPHFVPTVVRVAP